MSSKFVEVGDSDSLGTFVWFGSSFFAFFSPGSFFSSEELLVTCCRNFPGDIKGIVYQNVLDNDIVPASSKNDSLHKGKAQIHCSTVRHFGALSYTFISALCQWTVTANPV